MLEPREIISVWLSRPNAPKLTDKHINQLVAAFNIYAQQEIELAKEEMNMEMFYESRRKP